MKGKRAGVFDQEEDDFDVSGFAPKPAGADKGLPAEQVRAVAERSQFRSREPKSAPAQPEPRAQRRHRTGRNMQINIKARAEAIEAFYALADRQGWVLGEAFERAVEALGRDLKSQK
jgi:hypothetical protein